LRRLAHCGLLVLGHARCSSVRPAKDVHAPPRHLRGPSSSAISREAMAWAYMCQCRTVGRGGCGKVWPSQDLRRRFPACDSGSGEGFSDVQRSAIGSFRALLTPALTFAMRGASECRSARHCASSQGRRNGRTA
jgi:hypothetical protein